MGICAHVLWEKVPGSGQDTGAAWRNQSGVAQAGLSVLWPPLSDEVVALPRSSVVKERMASWMEGGILIFRIRWLGLF